MTKSKLTTATLNVKGLNDKQKQRNTLTLLKSYKLDIILLQETNLSNKDTREFLQQQWPFDSIWSSKAAILAGNKNILFRDNKIEQNGRVITTTTSYKNHILKITNVYAPPNQSDRILFFNRWTPTINPEAINIIGGDFNTNIYPDRDRISASLAQKDISRTLLLKNLKNFTDTSSVSENIPLLTFFQRTQGNRTMASHLDYIFIDEDHSYLATKLNTLYGNSDHKLVKCVFNF
jgi:exonuclease III